VRVIIIEMNVLPDDCRIQLVKQGDNGALSVDPRIGATKCCSKGVTRSMRNWKRIRAGDAVARTHYLRQKFNRLAFSCPALPAIARHWRIWGQNITCNQTRQTLTVYNLWRCGHATRAPHRSVAAPPVKVEPQCEQVGVHGPLSGNLAGETGET
jgi:hypothetical protein